MSAFNHYGKQLVGLVVICALLFAAIASTERPTLLKTDAEFYCKGWSFGWSFGYCGHDDNCNAPSAPSCAPPKEVRGPSLTAGVSDGMSAGAMDAGSLPDDHSDPASEPHGY